MQLVIVRNWMLVPCFYGYIRCQQKQRGALAAFTTVFEIIFFILRAAEGQSNFKSFLQGKCSVSGQGGTGGQEYPPGWFIHDT